MRKFLPILIFTLTACSTNDSLVTSNLVNEQVQANALKKITLSMDKKEGTEIKKIVVDKPIPSKKESALAKKTEKLDIKFTEPVGTNDYVSREYARRARYALNEMNKAYSFSEGYRIGLRELDYMRRDGVYVAKVAYPAAEAVESWSNGFKVVASALNHIADDRPNTPDEAVRLVMNMMSANDSWRDGYRVGVVALRVISNTDNRKVREIIDYGLRRAESAYDYKEAYDILIDTLRDLRNYF
ncbi:MAG: hypothetical protein KatS3mg068_0536 [Candidatus Sericytochromatia bacterium]|nr:MAG: hypothetical protein KatS3mg068_0536 [Candidatus Sericytochromatia bacterium]